MQSPGALLSSGSTARNRRERRPATSVTEGIRSPWWHSRDSPTAKPPHGQGESVTEQCHPHLPRGDILILGAGSRPQKPHGWFPCTSTACGLPAIEDKGLGRGFSAFLHPASHRDQVMLSPALTPALTPASLVSPHPSCPLSALTWSRNHRIPN